MNSVVLPVATKMLFHNHLRFFMTVIGIAIAFFLAAAQIGLMVGWINTTSAIINHANADIWVMAKETRAFEYGTAIPKHRIQQVASIQGVSWSEGMLAGWSLWQSPEGKRINVEVIGLDRSYAGGPWDMILGNLEVVTQAETIITDELYLGLLGISKIGNEAEMDGHRTILGGISRGVRTFTALPFVFTSLETAFDYIPSYSNDEITYVLARIDHNSDKQSVCKQIEREISNVEALTTAEFAERSVKYWMLETGVGITVIITAVLGLLVGAVIMSQTLFSITQDHIANYATLLALGFHQKTLRNIVLAQSLSLGGLGVVVGSVLFMLACNASARSPIPLETTPLVSLGLISFSLLCCIGAAWFSIRAIFKLDPVSVFHG